MPEVENSKAVFVIHGRNEDARRALFVFLRSLGLEPKEWSELLAATGQGSPYIVDVLAVCRRERVFPRDSAPAAPVSASKQPPGAILPAHSTINEVGQLLSDRLLDKAFMLARAVIVLMTPEEEVHLLERFGQSDDVADISLQSRPNVIFEAGMAMGRHPERTVIVEIGNLRSFSDISGRHVIRMNNTVGKRQELAQRLRTVGCEINLLGNDWHTDGDFEKVISDIDMDRLRVEVVAKLSADHDAMAKIPKPVEGMTYLTEKSGATRRRGPRRGRSGLRTPVA